MDRIVPETQPFPLKWVDPAPGRLLLLGVTGVMVELEENFIGSNEF